MTTLAEKLHKWSLDELNLVSEGGGRKLPDINSLRSLTKGKNKNIWNYVINHVRSESVVHDIKRTLHIKRILNEKESHAAYYNENLVDIEKLQSAVSIAIEKRTYHMGTLSTVEEIVHNLEQNIQNTKSEIFQINQKTALFELLKQQLSEKSVSVRNLNSQISSHKNALTAYQSTKLHDKLSSKVPYGFLNNCQVDYSEKISGIEDLLDLISVCNNNSDNNDTDTGTGHFLNNMSGLKRSGLLLTDLVFLIKEISNSDLQHITTASLHSFPGKDSIEHGDKKKSSRILLDQLKCDNVYNSVVVIKNKMCVEKLLIIQEKMFEDKIKGVVPDSNDLEFELKCTLIKKSAENEALVVGNNFIDNYLKSASCRTNFILENFQNQKQLYDDLSSVPEKFHKYADLTYFLMYTSSATFQKVLDNLNNLKSFAYNDLFKLPLPTVECLEELKKGLVSDRMQSWNFCDKTDVVTTFFCRPYSNDHLQSPKVLKSLNLERFENMSFLCENWTRIKQKLRAKSFAYSERCVYKESINVSEMNVKFSEMLERMKFSVDKSLLFISKGTMFCDKTKSEVHEWWEQNAQYIPHVEYGGKTLKMWIDILSVLSEFEPQKYTSKKH